MVPFIDVYVEPGEASDPSKLTFNYTLGFKDSRSIELEVAWDFPPYVSANQPEDQLVIQFNGPIYDKEDGTEMELGFRKIPRVIPP